jgi:hypothetical protein
LHCGGGEHAGEKGRVEAEKRKKIRVALWHGKQKMPVEREVILQLFSLELWALCKGRWVWAGAVIFASATFSLQVAKASDAMLPELEKTNSADLQRGIVNKSGFICTAVS